MKKLPVFAAAFLAAILTARADTSYLLIQGPFGLAGAESTFKWQVNYQPGILANGHDLLTAVFGAPVPDGTFNGDDYFSSGNSVQGAGYIDFGSTPGQLTSPFLVSITLGSVSVAQNPSYSPGYVYYLAGGGGAQSYPNAGAWTYSSLDGATTRTLSDGSYDAWVFGETWPTPAVINVADNTPTGTDFSGATVINVVPEPAGVVLLLVGAGGLSAFRRRRA